MQRKLKQKYGEDINFEQFLKKLGLNEENYILALKHTIKHNILVLKRIPAEIIRTWTETAQSRFKHINPVGHLCCV